MRPAFPAAIALAWVSALGCAASTGPSAKTDAGGADGGPTGDDSGGGNEAGRADAAPDTPAGPCAGDGDCAGGICGFPTAGACSAVGSCFPAPGATCLAYGPGCACDGTTVNLVCNGLPTGYAPKPLLHSGDCASDAGGPG